MRAGVVRAEGLKVTSVAAADLILIQQQQTNGNYLPREVAYSNFISGGVSLTPNSVVLTNGSGDLTTNAGLTFASSTLTFGSSIGVVNGFSRVTAHSGGGQASATLLPSTINWVNTVAAPGDSVKLPPAVVGMAITVLCSGNNLQIFGSGTDSINGLVSSVGTNQIPDTAVTYYCEQAGFWWSTSQDIQVGSDGNFGILEVYPATVANGTFNLQAQNSTGNFVSTLQNSNVGQNTAYTLPDPLGASANIMLSVGVNGTESTNAVTASGLDGVITTSSLTTAGGSSYAITWTNTKVSATSKVLVTYNGGTNTTRNITISAVPGSGSVTLTIYNNTAATALNGTVIMHYLVIS